METTKSKKEHKCICGKAYTTRNSLHAHTSRKGCKIELVVRTRDDQATYKRRQKKLKMQRLEGHELCCELRKPKSLSAWRRHLAKMPGCADAAAEILTRT